MKKEEAFATKVTENLFLETPKKEFKEIFKKNKFKSS